MFHRDQVQGASDAGKLFVNMYLNETFRGVNKFFAPGSDYC
jgi:hypothetical protein